MTHTTSTWQKDAEPGAYPRLDRNASTDVAIIGGGLTGILSAYLLAKAGKKVVVLEKSTIGSNATGLTTAFMTEYVDTAAEDLVKIFGEETAKKIYASHRGAINTIVKIAEEEGIDCELERCSNTVFAHEPDAFEELESEHPMLTKLGVEATLSDKPARGFENYGYIEIPDQAKFHPMKFLNTLARRAVEAGAEIYEHTEATKIRHKGDYLVETDGPHIEAQYVISATYEPFSQPASLFFKKGMYVTYVLEGEIPAGMIASGIYEDTMIPYHYFRVDSRGDGVDRIIFGGEDHRQDIPVDPEKNFAALEEFARKTLRGIPLTISRRWSGPILEPVDGIAYIGTHDADGIMYAFGFSGTGMTYAAIAAGIFYDTIMGEPNDWVKIYHPDRVPGPKSLAIKGRDYIEAFMHGAVKNTFRTRTKK